MEQNGPRRSQPCWRWNKPPKPIASTARSYEPENRSYEPENRNPKPETRSNQQPNPPCRNGYSELFLIPGAGKKARSGADPERGSTDFRIKSRGNVLTEPKMARHLLQAQAGIPGTHASAQPGLPQFPAAGAHPTPRARTRSHLHRADVSALPVHPARRLPRRLGPHPVHPRRGRPGPPRRRSAHRPRRPDQRTLAAPRRRRRDRPDHLPDPEGQRSGRGHRRPLRRLPGFVPRKKRRTTRHHPAGNPQPPAKNPDPDPGHQAGLNREVFSFQFSDLSFQQSKPEQGRGFVALLADASN